MSLSEIIAAAHNTAVEAGHGRTVVYHRGTRSVSVAAIVGRSVYDAEDAEGLITQVTSQDFLILVADLKLAISPEEEGEPVTYEMITPRPGDRITATLGIAASTFEVLPMPGQQCFLLDEQQARYRIHTKQIAST